MKSILHGHRFNVAQKLKVSVKYDNNPNLHSEEQNELEIPDGKNLLKKLSIFFEFINF